jgi:hypothetical protein
MDTEQLVSHGRTRFEHAGARRLLKEKYQAKLTFAHAGGMFRAGPELLTLLQAIPIEDNVVILDLYENPVRINPGDLQQIAFDRWQEQMNAWLVEFESNNQKR